MPAEFDRAVFDQAIARIPRWILALALAGTVVAMLRYGVSTAGGFLLGSLAAWVNFRLIERAATKVTHRARDGEKAGSGTGILVFIQFIALVLAALAILMFSGFSRLAAFGGLLVTPAAVLLEMVYELVTLRH